MKLFRKIAASAVSAAVVLFSSRLAVFAENTAIDEDFLLTFEIEETVGDLTYKIYENVNPETGAPLYDYGSQFYAIVSGYTETATNVEIPSYLMANTGDENGVSDALIPEDVREIPVTQIGEYAFRSCETLVSVIIPETIEEIASNAFSFCTALEDIRVLEGNPYFVSDKYLMDKEMTKVIKCPPAAGYFIEPTLDLPDTVTEIGDHAFEFCTWLHKANIPEGITKIGNYAFYECTEMFELTIPEGVTEIGTGAFAGTAKLPLSVDLPESLSLIGLKAFYGSGAAFRTESDIAVLYVDDWIVDTVEDTTQLTDIVIPWLTRGIAVGTFFNCDTLTSVDFSQCDFTLKYINPIAFYGCDSLKNVKFGYNSFVQRIEKNTFKNCISLESIELPESVAYIDETAFVGCESLGVVSIPNPGCIIFDSEETIPASARIHCWEGSSAHEYAEKYDRMVEFMSGDKPFYSGDSNMNGVVEVADAVFILQGIADPSNEKFMLPEEAKECADCYCPGDGIDAQDALAIQMKCADLVLLPLYDGFPNL